MINWLKQSKTKLNENSTENAQADVYANDTLSRDLTKQCG